MLCLPAPYGHDAIDGACIRLHAPGEVNPHAVEQVLRRYSCYPPVIPRIQSCLRHSGRYDCILQAGWFKGQQREVTEDLAGVGVTLEFMGYLKDTHRAQMGVWCQCKSCN